MAMTRDEDARLALATELRQAILSGSLVMARFAARGQADEAGNSAALMAKAVSHAVLTSGLRAPADAQAATFTASAGPIPPEATQVEASGTGRLKVTAEALAMFGYGPLAVLGREVEEDIPEGAPMEVNPATGKVRVARTSRPMVIVAAARRWLKNAPEHYNVDQADSCLDDLADSLQGWRARLANVERLLAEALGATAGFDQRVSQALAEVRSMLDGE